MAEFQAYFGDSAKPVSTDPSPNIPPQQTTAIAVCNGIDPSSFEGIRQRRSTHLYAADSATTPTVKGVGQLH
jgi:hypothetical protein